MGFWRSWTMQLQFGGFSELNANYPPIFLEWLWLVGTIYDLLGQLPGPDWLFKCWVLLPVVISQLVLLVLLAKVIGDSGRVVCRSPTFWLLAFNPAILMGGPVWGQVDILPMVPIIVGLYLYSRDSRYALWLPALGVSALFIKFQAIVFSPLYAALALRHPRHLAGGLVAGAVVAIIILIPFGVTGSLLESLRSAYTENLSAYPVATLNAANFWHLVGQNSRPDDLSVFGWTPVTHGWERLVTIKFLGIGIFGIVSLWVFLTALLRQDCDIWKYALILALGFFLFAPSMHERYVFPAVIVAAFAAAYQPRRFVVFLLATIVATLNIVLVLPPSGDGLWSLTSTLGLLLLAGLLLERTVVWGWLRRRAHWMAKKSSAKSGVIYTIIALGVIALPLSESLSRAAERRASREPDRIYVSEVLPASVKQAWGVLVQNRSVDNNPLRAGGRMWSKGLGTHANSIIRFKIPDGASAFEAHVAIDDESEHGNVEFLVYVDELLKWRSGVIDSTTAPVFTRVPLERNATELKLVVSDLGDNRSDHADWLGAFFDMKPSRRAGSAD
jgi:Gpi18-like mannosyltransferase